MRNNLHNHIKNIAAVVLLCSTLTNCGEGAHQEANLDADSPSHLTPPLQEQAIIPDIAAEVSHQERSERNYGNIDLLFYG